MVQFHRLKITHRMETKQNYYDHNFKTVEMMLNIPVGNTVINEIIATKNKKSK